MAGLNDHLRILAAIRISIKNSLTMYEAREQASGNRIVIAQTCVSLQDKERDIERLVQMLREVAGRLSVHDWVSILSLVIELIAYVNDT